MKKLIENIDLIFQLLLKSILFGLMPFFIFIMITSRTDIILGIKSYVVLTGSMEPTLPVGSVIFTQNFARYNIGDIVAFKSGNVNVTHRIIDTEVQGSSMLYKTQGDANAGPDSKLIEGSSILGKTFYHVPYIGRLAIFLKTLPGLITLIILPAAVFVVFEILNIKKELTKEIEKKMLQKMQAV